MFRRSGFSPMFPSSTPSICDFASILHMPFNKNKNKSHSFLTLTFDSNQLISLSLQGCAEQHPQWFHPRTPRGHLLDVNTRFGLACKPFFDPLSRYRPLHCACGRGVVVEPPNVRAWFWFVLQRSEQQ